MWRLGPEGLLASCEKEVVHILDAAGGVDESADGVAEAFLPGCGDAVLVEALQLRFQP